MDKALRIPLNVIPPFWFTWWFITLASLLILGLIVYIVSFFSRLRLQKKLHKLEIANSLQSERERIARELHDNVGSQLTYIISRLDSTKQKTTALEPVKEIEGSLENISSFARGTMQQLRESIWVMHKDSFTLDEFEMKLRDYISKYLDMESGIEWKIEVNDKYKTELSPGMVMNLFRIIQEAVNNTTKHANASRITISIASEPKKLIVSINDNGTGISNKVSDSIGHYGFQNMKKRAEELNGSLSIDSKPGFGTTIHLDIITN